MTVKTVWDVAHACKHEEAHDLSAKRVSERAGYARWLASKDCSACWGSERNREARERDAWLAERRASELGRIEAWESRFALPVLDGLEKAVGWGRRVRYQLLVATHDTVGLDEDSFAARIETSARQVTSASWWIDQRDAEPADMEELLADAVGIEPVPANDGQL